MKRRTLLAAAAAVPAVTGMRGASAQAWPDKPVKFVLSQPPGSGPDNVARFLAERLAKPLGQPVVIDNKPGGQNVIGAQAVARGPADGYTFYFATTAALVSNVYLFKSLPYDPQKDFVPVAFVARSPFAILVPTASPIRSLEDLIARAKAEPGKVSLANEGPRTFGGIIARFFNARAGVQTNLVGYASVAVSIQNAVGGQVDAVIADVASTAQLVRGGRLRMLATTAGKRIAGWEQVPALAETLPGFDMSGWFAVVAPTGTPAPAVARLNRDLNALLTDRETAERILSIGPIVEVLGAPEATGAFLRDEHQRWGQVAKEIGLLPE